MKTFFKKTIIIAAFALGGCVSNTGSAQGSDSFTGVASYYGHGERLGKYTASGERFNPYAMTAAHRTLPLNTKLVITNLENGTVCHVRINDRGPARSTHRIIDLSWGASRACGMNNGTTRVRIAKE